jgi:type III pantothenate kinase
MDINAMVLSVGNTRLAIGIFAGGELQYVNRVLNSERGDWPTILQQAWARISGLESPAVVGATVNPPLVEPLEHFIQQTIGQPIHWVGSEIDLPIKVLTQSPEITGVDRIVNIAAAFEQMGKACVVVDAGTAITVDCCNDAGEFVGGAISPGVDMMLDVLHEKTARLPRAQFQTPAEPFGTSTESAICQGIYFGIRGMVRELTENYATALGFWPDIIATGGNAAQLFEGWELIHAIAPDLTLYGIALAYANHIIKHNP